MKIGDWWLAKQDALINETVEWSFFANRSQSANRAVGGKLFVTNKRLLFSPHYFDYILNGKIWQTELRNVRQIGVLKKGGDVFGGGLRDRLRIDLRDGQTELFVVNNLTKIVERLRSTIIEKE
ncbi:MAG: hypothetical protein H7Z37_09145 [Pyrinomonadaceae bacterium]|nr:hypothetical protein [Pyrinomonadaceae bacterium]